MSTSEHNPDPDVEIGRIAGAFGIRGEVKLEPYADAPERYNHLKGATARLPDGSRRPLVINGARRHKTHILLRIQGVDSANDTEPLIGATLVIPLSQRPPLPAGQYYISDLLGLDVITTAGETVGPITDVLHTREHDIYVTRRGLIPAVKEFIRDVDLDKRRVVISPVEGLLEPLEETNDES
jgi:16S rRNA processing protein RimM